MTIMIQGTTSKAGTSLITAGLCRILNKDGFSVAPFNSQNMTVKTVITEDGREISKVQAVQARFAGTEPDVRMNPVLLKPAGSSFCDVIVNGKFVENMTPRQYGKFCHSLADTVMSAFRSLSSEYDIIVIEGVGSPVELSFSSKNPLINMELAKLTGSPVVMVGDIDRGGVIASLLGTSLLLDDDERSLMKGIILNKFLGNRAEPDLGIDVLEATVRKPVVGVVPFMDIYSPDDFPDGCSDHSDSAVIRQMNMIEAVLRDSLDMKKLMDIIKSGGMLL